MIRHREEEINEEMNGDETEIRREEIIEQLVKLKKAKTSGCDNIENEPWRRMPIEIGEAFHRLINRIWRGERIPE